MRIKDLVSSEEAEINFKNIVPNAPLATPVILKYCKINDYDIEISYGMFIGNICYNVAIVKDKKYLREMDKIIFSESEVIDYINYLKTN